MIEGIGILFTRFSAEQFNAGKLQDDFFILYLSKDTGTKIVSIENSDTIH